MGFKLAKGRLLVISAIIVAAIIASNWSGIQTYVHSQQPASIANVSITTSVDKIDINTADLLKYTNENRQTPLALDERLNRSAQAKCEDMVAKNYWSHDAPGKTNTWQGFIEHEIPDAAGQWIGENLSEGYRTSQAIVTGWMGSPKHRANIVKPEFSMVGFGVCYSGSYSGDSGHPATIVVQHFAG